MKKCINCGKMFENKDKRVKRCDSCRFGVDKEKKMKEIEKDLRENTERLAKIRRKALIKKIIIISILALIEILILVLIFIK